MKNVTLTNSLLTVLIMLMGPLYVKVQNIDKAVAVIETKLEFQYGNQSGQHTSNTGKRWDELIPTVFVHKAEPTYGLP